MILAVIDAYDVEDKITIGQQCCRGRQCGAGGDDVVIYYHLSLGNGPEQMKVRGQTVAVDALHRIGIEWYTEIVRDSLTYRRGKVEPVCMTAPWCRDYSPIFRIIDKTLNEVAGSVGKQCGYIGRLLNLAERYAALCASELREIHQGAELMNHSPGREVAKRDIPTLQPWLRGRNIPFVHSYDSTAPCHCRWCQIRAGCLL